jgi:hypothetical protein
VSRIRASNKWSKVKGREGPAAPWNRDTDDLLRSAAYVGLRVDKPATDARRPAVVMDPPS